MYLTVFQEFHDKAILDRVRNEVGLEVDVAPEPNAMAKSDVELEIVSTNAKLMLLPRYAEQSYINSPKPADDAAVDNLLAKLAGLGFVVTNRHPVTSAGCPMIDRVLLKFPKP